MQKYIWVTRGQDRVKVMIMVDLVLVKKTMLRYINSVGSDHHVVLCKVRLVNE